MEGGGTLASAAANVKNVEYRALVRRVYGVASRILAGIVLTAGVLVAVAVLRLMAGPIDLDFVRDRLTREFDTPGDKLRIDADRVYAEWGGISQPMQLVLTGLHVTNGDKQMIAAAPSIALSFDPRGVLTGHLLPNAIVVDRPIFNADIAREGGMLRRVLESGDSATQDKVVDLLIDQLLSEPNHDSLLGQLDTVQVVHARVSVRDVPSGVIWLANDVDARLKRDASGVIIAAGARFSNGHEPVDVALSGTYARDRSRMSFEARVDGLKPLMLADLSPDAALLRGVDVPLGAHLQIEAAGDGTIQTVDMEVTGGAGTLSLPGILPTVHQVHSVNAHVSIDAATHSTKIERVDIDVGAARVRITGAGKRTEQGQSFAGRAEVKHIPIDQLGDYWPLVFAEGGRAWALANLSRGSLDVAADFALSAPDHDISRLKVDRLAAFLDYRGMTVHYMAHMPELQGVTGKARFEGGTLRFDVAGGAAVGLALSAGTISLTGLDGPPPHYAAMRLPISGPAATMMAFLARAKLGLPKDALYDPKRLAGEVSVDLALAFPLLKELGVADIDVNADAVLTGLSIKSVVGGVDLTDASARVSYAGSRLEVQGQGKLDGEAADIAWRENFSSKAPFRQRYELKGTLSAGTLAKAGFPSPEPYVSGPLGLTVAYQVAGNGTGEVTGKVDLKGATVAVPELDWSKLPNADAQLGFTLKLAPGGKLTAAEFDGRANGLATKGSMRFTGDNVLQSIALQQLTLGKSSVAIDWTRGAAAGEIAVRGRALELARVRRFLKARDDSIKDRTAGTTAPARALVSFQLDQVYSKHGELGALSGRMEFAGDRLASADLSLGGGAGSGKGATLRVAAEGQGRSVGLYIADLGQFLKDAGWLDGLSGASLDFRGTFDDGAADAPLLGKVRLGPYKMAKVVQREDVGTLNSTIDALNHAGDATQQFDSLEARVNKFGDRIDIRDGRTSGHSIGVTTAGWLDLGSERARLRGIVVPAFALNNLLSNVPVLGPLLTGGKDGGLFAISYGVEGPFDDLKSEVNIMSTITPGALRSLFTAPLDTTATPQSPEQPSSP